MPPKPKQITTAADRLYDLIKQKKEVSFKEAAEKLKVPIKTIEAWGTFLEEDELLAIKYKLTTPYLTMPTPDKNKSKKQPKMPASFEDRLVSFEINSEIEHTNELLDTADESRSKGEFAVLANVSNELLAKIKKIVDYLVSRIELSPQIKTEIMKQLHIIEKQTGSAAELLTENKFDEANTAYAKLHDDMRKMLDNTNKEYTEIKAETNADESTMQKLLESTYNDLDQGNLEAAESNYNKMRRMFGAFSHKFVSDRSHMQEGILKLNRDLAVYSNKIKQERMHEGSERINQLLNLTNQRIKRRQFIEATASYIQIKQIFEWLPDGFLREKRKLKENILKVFAQIAKERESRLSSKFNIMSKQLGGMLKDINTKLTEGNLKEALSLYKTSAKLYSRLPKGFMSEKLQLQNQLVAVYNILSSKLAMASERGMSVRTQKIGALLQELEQKTEEGSLEEADQTYSEINSIFKKLPEGYISRKTALQGKIIEKYEKLLEKKDSTKTTSFKNSTENLDNFITQAYAKLKKSDYKGANALYKKIKATYVQLQPTDIKQRELVRNRILALYRRILMVSPSSNEYETEELPIRPVANTINIHARIEKLKSHSKARVRMPA